MSTQIPTTVDLPFGRLSANICAELACGLSDVEGIKRRYELTDNEWNRLKHSPAFRAMMRDALRKFRGDMNAGKRITVKSEVALEDSIPLLYEWAHDSEIAISNRLDAVKQMTVLAGRTGKEQQAGAGGHGGGGFNVNIVIKGHERREIIDVTTSTPQLEVVDGEVED